MNHDEAYKLLGAYHDGELDLATCVKMEEHIAGCATCQQKLAGEKQLVELLQNDLPAFTPSPFLKTRIKAAIREKEKFAAPWWQRFAIPSMALSGFGLVIIAAAVLFFALPQAIPEVALEGVSDHIRSLQVNHLMDVVSTDQHTVKPWFAGKLDYSPPVVDLTGAGYPLIGGRLDVLDHRYVAAIIYQRRKHYINLFIWPSDKDQLNGHLYTVTTYHAIGWTKSGLNYLAVSELGQKELDDFVGMIQEQTVDVRPGE